ncbi:hypothetical protein FRC06_010085, partial [Ceratobasidium sp. 370]
MDALPAGSRWPVLLATRAYGQLRTLERDQKALGIVHSKIKELSSGQFTRDNHRPVIGSTEHIPIYRAKVPNDLRIIYQISVEPDTQNEYDRQVIKILRIQSRAHVDYQFWAKVSQHFATKGPVHRRRCKYRFLVGGSRLAALPAKFPAGVYQNAALQELIEYEYPEAREDTIDEQEELQNTVG